MKYTVCCFSCLLQGMKKCKQMPQREDGMKRVERGAGVWRGCPPHAGHLPLQCWFLCATPQPAAHYSKLPSKLQDPAAFL